MCCAFVACLAWSIAISFWKQRRRQARRLPTEQEARQNKVRVQSSSRNPVVMIVDSHADEMLGINDEDPDIVFVKQVFYGGV